MAIADNSAAEIKEKEEQNSNSSPLSAKKRTKDPGVRVKGGRIYDSENGRTCHQCRQKTRDFAATCKMMNKDKPCPLTFCHKCLFNRYGEKAEEVGKLDDWTCPKCRGGCNCSFCMKKKGYAPTGILAHTAKANGFNSVQDLLHNKGSDVLEVASKDSTTSPKKSPISDKKGSAKRNRDKENQSAAQNAASNEEKLKRKEKKEKRISKRVKFSDEIAADRHIVDAKPLKSCKTKDDSGKSSNNDADRAKENADTSEANPLPKGPTLKKLAMKPHIEPRKQDVVLPLGSPLIEVAGVELPAQDVGSALQFLEFCDAFSEVLGLKKGESESVLQDITQGRVKRHKGHGPLVRFSIKLLSLIEQDIKKDGDTWLQTLKTCMEGSECKLEELPLDFLDKGSSGYNNLEPSEKLKILSFICDEVLVTEQLRNCIDDAAAKFDEGRKENKEKVVAAKKKEKLIKQKAKDEVAKAMLSARGGTPLSLAEFDDLLSQIRSEADKVHAEVVASLELVPKKNQRFDAVRTDSMMLEGYGKILWKLGSHNNRSNIILQDIGNWDSVTHQDKWFIYNEEEEKIVEKFIASLRTPTSIGHTSDEAEEGTKPDSSESPEDEYGLDQVEMEA